MTQVSNQVSVCYYIKSYQTTFRKLKSNQTFIQLKTATLQSWVAPSTSKPPHFSPTMCLSLDPIVIHLYCPYYRIDFDLLSSSVTADNHPELLQQLEKLKALADRLQESEVGISHW